MKVNPAHSNLTNAQTTKLWEKSAHSQRNRRFIYRVLHMRIDMQC